MDEEPVLDRSIAILRHDLDYRKSKLLEAIDESDDPIEILLPEGGPELIGNTLIDLEEHDTAIGYFVVASELLKVMEDQLFEIVFIKEDYRDGTILNYLGTKSKYDTFNRFDIIERDLNEKIKRTHDFRSELVHSPHESLREIGIGELEDRIEDSYDAVTDLQRQLVEMANVTDE